jgi:hypothetical protein
MLLFLFIGIVIGLVCTIGPLIFLCLFIGINWLWGIPLGIIAYAVLWQLLKILEKNEEK